MSRSIQDAIKANNVQEVTIRLNMGEDINQCYHPRYETPLHCAVEVKNTEIVQILLDRGAELNQGDRNGDTPLQLAVRSGYRDLVSLLESAGATTTSLPCPLLLEKAVGRPPPWLEERMRSGLPTPVLPPKEIGGTLHSEPNATNSFLSLKTPSWLKKGHSDESEKAIISHLGAERDIEEKPQKTTWKTPSWFKKEQSQKMLPPLGESNEIMKNGTAPYLSSSIGKELKESESTNPLLSCAKDELVTLEANSSESMENKSPQGAFNYADEVENVILNNIEQKKTPRTRVKGSGRPLEISEQTMMDEFHSKFAIMKKRAEEKAAKLEKSSATHLPQETDTPIYAKSLKDNVSNLWDHLGSKNKLKNEVTVTTSNTSKEREKDKQSETNTSGVKQKLDVSKNIESYDMIKSKKMEDNDITPGKASTVKNTTKAMNKLRDLKTNINIQVDKIKTTAKTDENSSNMKSRMSNMMSRKKKGTEVNREAGEKPQKRLAEKCTYISNKLRSPFERKHRQREIVAEYGKKPGTTLLDVNNIKGTLRQHLKGFSNINKNDKCNLESSSDIIEVVDTEKGKLENESENKHKAETLSIQKVKDKIILTAKNIRISKNEEDKNVSDSPDEVEKINDDIHVSNIQRTKQKITKLFQASRREETMKECEEKESSSNKGVGFLLIWLRNRKGKKLNLFTFRKSPSKSSKKSPQKSPQKSPKTFLS